MRLRNLRPSYLIRRSCQLRFERAHPEAPWLTKSAVLLLHEWLKPTDVGFEWGSGRSTVWFARRVLHLTSVEDSPKWYGDVSQQLMESGLAAKVDYRFVPCELHEQAEPESHTYANVCRELPDGSLDFALVDANIRALCMRLIIPKVRPGGLLILDNANRYVPNPFLGGFTTIHEPRSEPRSEVWAQVLASLADWRRIDTTDGIWDTRFWVKPNS